MSGWEWNIRGGRETIRMSQNTRGSRANPRAELNTSESRANSREAGIPGSRANPRAQPEYLWKQGKLSREARILAEVEQICAKPENR